MLYCEIQAKVFLRHCHLTLEGLPRFFPIHPKPTINSKIVLTLMPTCFSSGLEIICTSSSRAMTHLRLNGWRMPQVALVLTLVIISHHVHRPHLQLSKFQWMVELKTVP